MKRIFLVSTAAAMLVIAGCASEQPIAGLSTTTVTVSPSESTTTETTTAESEETTETSSTDAATSSEQNDAAQAGYVTLGADTECSGQEINNSDTPKHLDPEKKTWVWYYPYDTPGFSIYIDEESTFKFRKVVATFGDADRPFYGKEVLFNERSLTDAQVGIKPTQRRAFYFLDDTRPATFIFCS